MQAFMAACLSPAGFCFATQSSSIFWCIAIESFAESSAAAPSLTPLHKDADDEVRAIAAWALGAIESRAALPALEAVREDRSPAVRHAVRWAITAIDDRR